MEAEKSHYLLSANWRIRKVSCIIWSESKGLRIKEADGVSLRPKGYELGGQGLMV